MSAHPGSKITTVVFDVDGTLYDQRRLRLSMVRQLAFYCAAHAWSARGTLRAIRAFRNAQEFLRRSGTEPAFGGSLANAQLEHASRESGIAVDVMRRITDDWMFRRPLPLLSKCADAALSSLLADLRAKGVRLGVYSDYPVEGKLAAMNILTAFDVVVSSYDGEVGRFKPSPRGFEVCLARLGASPQSAMYVGDRPEIDGEGAIAAGMRAVILNSRSSSGTAGRFQTIQSLHELTRLIG